MGFGISGLCREGCEGITKVLGELEKENGDQVVQKNAPITGPYQSISSESKEVGV